MSQFPVIEILPLAVPGPAGVDGAASVVQGDGTLVTGTTTKTVAVDGTVVRTNDARLVDARTPLAHTQTVNTLSDSSAAGRTLLTAADASAQRTALGLGTVATENIVPVSKGGTGVSSFATPGGFLRHLLLVSGTSTSIDSQLTVAIDSHTLSFNNITATGQLKGQTVQADLTLYVGTTAINGIVPPTSGINILKFETTGRATGKVPAITNITGNQVTMEWVTNGAGSVSSVGLALPGSVFSVTGSPITGSGTLTGAFVNQTTNLVFASPNGSTGAPTFRALTEADIPTGLAHGNLSELDQDQHEQYFHLNPNTTTRNDTQPDAADVPAHVIREFAGSNTGLNRLTAIIASDGTVIMETLSFGSNNEYEVDFNAGVYALAGMNVSSMFSVSVTASTFTNMLILLPAAPSGTNNTLTMRTPQNGPGAAEFVMISTTGSGANTAVMTWVGTNGTGTLVRTTNAALVTPNLGTPSAVTLTNATGLPIIAGTTGTLSTARGGTGTTTATGSGDNVLATSPTLVTPNIGTPSAGVATNITGLPWSTGVTGKPTTISGYGITDGFAETATLIGQRIVVVKAAGTGNLTLSGAQTIDGSSCVAGDYVLAPKQTTASQNGVYAVAAGAWTRVTEFDSAVEFAGRLIFVTTGTVNINTWWAASVANPTVGTTSVYFYPVFGANGIHETLKLSAAGVDSNPFSLAGAPNGGLNLGKGWKLLGGTTTGTRPFIGFSSVGTSADTSLGWIGNTADNVIAIGVAGFVGFSCNGSAESFTMGSVPGVGTISGRWTFNARLSYGNARDYAARFSAATTGGGATGTPNITEWTNFGGAVYCAVADTGDFNFAVAGCGIGIKEGTNAKMGVATLVAGTVVVNTTKVTANSRIFLTIQSAGGTLGSVYISARTAGTSFTISSSSALDTSIVAWMIVEPT